MANHVINGTLYATGHGIRPRTHVRRRLGLDVAERRPVGMLLEVAQPVRYDVEPRIRVLLPLLEACQRRLLQHRGRGQPQDRHQRVADQELCPFELRQRGDELFHHHVGPDGVVDVFPFVEEPESLAEQHLTNDVETREGDELVEIHRLVSPDVGVHPALELFDHTVDGLFVLDHVGQRVPRSECLGSLDLDFGIARGHWVLESPIGNGGYAVEVALEKKKKKGSTNARWQDWIWYGAKEMTVQAYLPCAEAGEVASSQHPGA